MLFDPECHPGDLVEQWIQRLRESYWHDCQTSVSQTAGRRGRHAVPARFCEHPRRSRRFQSRSRIWRPILVFFCLYGTDEAFGLQRREKQSLPIAKSFCNGLRI